MTNTPELLNYGAFGFAVVVLGVLVIALKYFIETSTNSRKFMERLVEKNDEIQKDTNGVLRGMIKALDEMRSQMRLDRDASRAEYRSIIEHLDRVESAAEKLAECINGMNH